MFGQKLDFIVNYYLQDDKIEVLEVKKQNSGCAPPLLPCLPPLREAFRVLARLRLTPRVVRDPFRRDPFPKLVKKSRVPRAFKGIPSVGSKEVGAPPPSLPA